VSHLNAILTQNDRVNMTASYIKSEWTDLVLNWEYKDWFELVNGVKTPVHQESESYNGRSMMSTPPWNMNLTYDHIFNLPNGGTVKAAVTIKYKTAFDLSWRKIDYPLNYQESYHIEDFNVVYNSPDAKWSVSAYAKNAFNYAEKRNILNMASSKLLSIGNPRTYGGVLSVKF
jgi:hypothetical protein